MNHLTDQGERAVRLLTQLAYGDLALVRDALAKHGNGPVEDVIKYITDRRTRPLSSGATGASHSTASMTVEA